MGVLRRESVRQVTIVGVVEAMFRAILFHGARRQRRVQGGQCQAQGLSRAILFHGARRYKKKNPNSLQRTLIVIWGQVPFCEKVPVPILR